MRDRDFERARNTLARTAEDKTTIPESFELVGDGALYGRKGRTHTLLIPVEVPRLDFDHARIRVIGGGEMLTERHVEVHSWLRNFYNWNVSGLCGIEADDVSWGDGNINGKDTGGTVRSANRAFCQGNYTMEVTGNRVLPSYGYVAAETVDGYGIMVGTDDTPVDWQDDVALGSQIAHGTGSGEFYYAMSELPIIYSFDSGTMTRSHYRYFDNFNSDSNTISVAEVGLAGSLFISSNYNFLVARDVLGEAVDVPFRALLEVMYEYSLDYPGSGSPLRNFYNWTFSQFASVNGDDPNFEDGDVNTRDIYGNMVSPSMAQVIGFGSGHAVDNPASGLCGANGWNFQGLVIGTGDTEVEFDNYDLNSRIAHATMNYAAGSTPAGSWADPVFTVSHSRNFTNVSGGDVSVRESGVSARFLTQFPIINRYVLVMHDVFSTLTIPNGDVLALTYQLNVTYPS